MLAYRLRCLFHRR